MSNNQLSKIKDEQDLCISCGFCCDKTLFDIATIGKEEKTFGAFSENEIKIKGVRYLKLPCVYFDCKCSIYDQKKLSICSTFKCKLLRNMTKGEVMKEDALQIVNDVKTYRLEILKEFKVLTGKTLSFIDLYHEVSSNQEFETNLEKKKFKFKVQLLDIQLTKEFKSKKEFNNFYKMID